MPTLSATLILRPKRVGRRCDDCKTNIGGPHIKLFGMADSEKPHEARFCMRCANKLPSEEVKALVARFRRVVDAECVRTKQWRQIVASLSAR